MLVYGQMNEPPGARWRVPISAMTIAEYFRDVRRRTYSCSWTTCSASSRPARSVGPAGPAPSRVGYQPTLADEVAALQERIASVGRRRSPRSRLSMCRPTTSPILLSPRSPPTSTAWSCSRERWRPRACIRRSIRSRPRRCCSTRWSSARSIAIATEMRRGDRALPRAAGRHLASRHGGARRRGPRIVERARRLQRFLTQPFAVTEAFTGTPVARQIADTVAGCKAILAGECDDWRESSLYMVGSLDEAREKEARRATPSAGRRRRGHERALHLTIATPASILVDAEDVRPPRRRRKRRVRHAAGSR